MDEEKYRDQFQTYTGRRNFLQRPFFPIYVLLAVSYLLIIIGLVVALSKITTVSSELNKTHASLAKDPFGSDFVLFPCGSDNRQWEYFNGKCYFFSLETVSWTRARNLCQSSDSQLVTIDGFPKQFFLQTRTRNERFWIGLHDIQTEGEWKWLDGSDYITGFKNWKAGEPNSYRNTDEDCGQLWINGEWNDYDCSSISYYVCEKALPSKSRVA
ncbi:hepatic lectin-like [Tiliqua scincoides]|uniref:hepatic lectin-like n=1 Tax=Tiliqua scincoides TaxID=71010 RepID=UPI003463141A